MRRNGAKAAFTSAEVQRIPGDSLNIFCRMRERNKALCGGTNISVRTATLARTAHASFPLSPAPRWVPNPPSTLRTVAR